MNTRPPELRRGRPDDLPALSRLLEDIGLPSSDLTATDLAHFQLAEANGKLVASAGVEVAGTVGLLRSVVVAPGFRGGGLARRLVFACESASRAMGISALYMIASDAAAVTFFDHMDYALIDRQDIPLDLLRLPEFTHLCPQTHPCLWKPHNLPT